ncbi:MAG: DUF167 domain-containing protein [Dehalococcoidia bacterium]|nr:DUF167 domain-containing protein [Dehalococcoidia bacterium]
MTKQSTSVRILVQAHPGAKRNEVVRFEGGVWHIKVAAPPVGGKANKKLIEFLSEVLGISKSRVTLEKGTTSRKKLILVEGMTDGEVGERMGRKIITHRIISIAC